jgi:hypothetical protein
MIGAGASDRDATPDAKLAADSEIVNVARGRERDRERE